VNPSETVPCLIVGAGPTGLALAAQLRWFGVPFRIIERSFDRTHESRALGVQARTLEVLDSLALADAMVARGSTSTRVVIHLGAQTVASVNLAEFGVPDTRYPFILFISQAETERILLEHLSSRGVAIERGVELVEFEAVDRFIQCVLRHPGGHEERVRTGFLAGCDGAHSFVRRRAGFSFQGDSYPEDFVLGDVEVEGPLEPGAINSFAGEGGAAIFFPLGSPTTWRVIALVARHPDARRDDPAEGESPVGSLTLEDLQSIVAVPTEGSVVVRDPAWLSHFRLHHRQVEHYRQGRVFLAGDAAHIHSPVGAQGMNTGIQDAWNLGWKLALTIRGAAEEPLLDSYQSERWPVGRRLLRYTDRVFSVFVRGMSAGRLASWARRVVVPQLLPRLLGPSPLRSTAFGFVSQLRINYRRSPAVVEGRPRLRHGPRAGDRLPDAGVTSNGRQISLHRAIIGPHLSLLLCGEPGAWDDAALARLADRHAGLLTIHRLARQVAPGTLVDGGRALAFLGVENRAQYLVRPDGHIAFRCGGSDLDSLRDYVSRWFSGPGARVVSG
jgi:2-polyprenyl-6-methoxyphenol hydroxylase-like FAD-dependent oxidoreductase